MFNYLNGEIYRTLRKKSMYIFFGIIALLYFLLVFIRIGGADERAVLDDAGSLSGLLTAVIGGYLFASFYTDDLNSKNLITLIGFGMGKAKIVISKLILIALFSAVIFGILPLIMSGIYAALGHPPSSDIIGYVYAQSLCVFLQIVAFSALSAAVVYGFQRATFGIVAYLLLAFGIAGQLLSLLFNWEVIRNAFPNLSEHLMSGISSRILFGIIGGETIYAPVIEYIVYVGIATALSIFAFHKKELEF